MPSARSAASAASLADEIDLNPQIVDRQELTRSPDATVVAYYVMTREAGRAWSAVNHLSSGARGGVVWIGGAAGSGKTHFLNYTVALSARAGSPDATGGRHLTVAVVLKRTRDLGADLAEGIARELDAGRAAANLWRHLSGVDALRVVLGQTRRLGVSSLTLVVDCGTLDVAPLAAQFAAVNELLINATAPKIVVVAAGRSAGVAASIPAFALDPPGEEESAVIIGHARRLKRIPARPLEQLYRGTGLSEARMAAIWPFQPAAAALLPEFDGTPRRIPVCARIARDAIAAWREAPEKLIASADILRLPSAQNALQERLSASEGNAFRIAQRAALTMDPQDAEPSSAIVAVLALKHLAAPRQALSLATLHEHLRGRAPTPLSGAEHAELARIVADLATRSHATIFYSASERSARFNPEAAAAPQIAAFNRALPLLRYFRADLAEVALPSELAAALERAREAMAFVLEEAERSRKILREAAHDFGTTLAPERERTLADVIEIARRGPEGVPAGTIAEGAERSLREYATIAAIAAAVPRLRAMREYLCDLGLIEPRDDPGQSDAIARLESECKLLIVDIGGALHARSSAALDALESRFQRFKWTYVPIYRAAHQAWQKDMEQAVNLATDARQYVAALERLNTIGALGAPLAVELRRELTEATPQLRSCDPETALAPEVTPRCPRCHFVLGTVAPIEALAAIVDRARRALDEKLRLLSQSAVIRLIRDHDRGRRLEGFLKITQAAQADAIIKVLDDELTEYLASLLEENRAAPPTAQRSDEPAVAEASASKVRSKPPRSRATVSPLLPAGGRAKTR